MNKNLNSKSNSSTVSTHKSTPTSASPKYLNILDTGASKLITIMESDFELDAGKLDPVKVVEIGSQEESPTLIFL